MDKKKIWIMNHYAISPKSSGGTRHYDFAIELVKRGYEVSIFASSFDHKSREEKLTKGEEYKIEIIDGIKFVWVKTYNYKKNDFRRLLNMLSFGLKSYLIGLKQDKPDTILASSVHLLTCVSGYLLSKRFKAKYLAEIRDLWPQTLIDMGAIKEKSLITRGLEYIEKFVYKKASKIIVLLPGAVNYMKELGIDDTKIVYLPNGVSIERYDKIKKNNYLNDNKDIDKIINTNPEKFVAVYLGAFGKANALETIIEAANIIEKKGYSDIQILMIGDGPEKVNMVKKIQEHNLKNVSIYEPIKKMEIPLLLERIDVQLVSMRDLNLYKYGISLNKIFDYLCASKPIVFSGNVLNDIVKESNSGLSVAPEKPEDFAQAIIEIYNYSTLKRKELGENGRRFVEKHHDISKLVQRLVDII